jgi:TPR repeat protein
VPQSNEEAVKWYLKAANQGDEDAWMILGEPELSTNIE